MADDWIKFRRKLLKDGRVLFLSRTCRANRATALGALVILWSLADEYADENGLLRGYTKRDIDLEVDLPGFCDSLPPDWFEERDGSVYLPNYQEHNGDTAKRRAENTKRQRKSRAGKKDVALLSRDLRDKSATREEKRREEKNTNPPSPLPFPSEEFKTAWSSWIEHRKEIKKPIKPQGEKMALEKLRDFGEAKAIEAMRNSIAGGWQGLFDPSEKKNVARNGSGPDYDAVLARLNAQDRL